MLADVLDFN